MIEFINASKTYVDSHRREIAAVSELVLHVPQGSTVCLIGTSGSGKTTALKMVNRLIEPTTGVIRVDGRDVQDTDPIKLRRGIGYVIQRGGLFPHMTIEKNCGIMCRLEGWDRRRIRARVSALLELVNLNPEEYAHRAPSELSGGQRQRVGVARALALDPAVILMDEPFGAVDPITRAQLHEEFLQLKSRVGKTVLLVTHDMAEAFKLGDQVALMNEGRLVQVGTQEDFEHHPATAFVSAFMADHFNEDLSPSNRDN
ncbi:MAG: ABC transporter ATP-binding protein [Phycisphaerae bacterium]